MWQPPTVLWLVGNCLFLVSAYASVSSTMCQAWEMAYCKFWHGHLSTALCRVPCCALCAKDAALLFEEGRPPIKKPVDKRVVHWVSCLI